MLRRKTMNRAMNAIKWLKENNVVALTTQRELFGFLGYFRWNEFPYKTTNLDDIYDTYSYNMYSKYRSNNYKPVINWLIEKGLIYIKYCDNKMEYHITKDNINDKISKIKAELRENYDYWFKEDYDLDTDEDDTNGEYIGDMFSLMSNSKEDEDDKDTVNISKEEYEQLLACKQYVIMDSILADELKNDKTLCYNLYKAINS